MSNRLWRASLGAGLVALLALPAGAQVEATTLERTIVGVAGERSLAYGPGEAPYRVRTLGWRDPGGRGRALAGFKQVSDVHVLDEESPGRVEYFDACGSDFTSAYRVQEAMSLQVGNSMLKQLNAITNGPATGVPLDFVISTGDNVDNNQLNETRWFVDLLDGTDVTGRRIEPNSGGPEYEGYTREQYSQALPDEVLELAQQPFDSVGAGEWYGVLGNHDGLVQGNVPANPFFNGIVTGGNKAFVNIDTYGDCPDEPSDVAGIAGKVFGALTNQGRSVTADSDRRFLGHEELVRQYLDSPGEPAGHGFAEAPEDPDSGLTAGYYGFDFGRRIRGVVLDTIASDGGPDGIITDAQFKWLAGELKRYSRLYFNGNERVRNERGRNRLIVLFSHHSSVTLDNPSGDPNAHCFERSGGSPNCRGNESLRELIERFPNVVAWINGHEHNNAVRAYPFAGKDSTRGFWEINTAAHIDWPQQSRLIEIAWKPGRGRRADTVFIYGTAVDHASAPMAYETAPPPYDGSTPVEDYLAAVSRVEAFYDACGREGQSDCGARGARRDRNVRLVMKAPFDLGRRRGSR